MKKSKFLCVGSLALAAIVAFTGCSCQKDNQTEVQKALGEAKTMSVSDLTEKAKAEKGNFIAYSTSSKTASTVQNFCKAYKLDTDENCTNPELWGGKQEKEGDIYSVIETMTSANNAGLDVVVTQNGASLQTYLDNELLYTFNPKDTDAKETDPYAFMYYVKEFSIIKGQENVPTNVWDLVDTTRTVYYKKTSEPINRIFMAQLTTDAWASKLANAYKAKYGVDDAGLQSKLTEGKYKNAGYMFIDMFLKRVTNYSSESDLAKAIAGTLTGEDKTQAEAGSIGFTPVSKYKTGESGNYNKVDFLNNMDGFKGFAYNFYGEVSKTTDRPYTAALFMHYLSTQDGIAKYVDGNGVYSAFDETTKDKLAGYVVEDYSSIKDIWVEITKQLEQY